MDPKHCGQPMQLGTTLNVDDMYDDVDKVTCGVCGHWYHIRTDERNAILKARQPREPDDDRQAE